MGQYNCGDYMSNMDENYIYYVVSKNLKRIRKEKKLTQQQLADLSNYSVEFSKVLDVDVREFFKPLD